MKCHRCSGTGELGGVPDQHDLDVDVEVPECPECGGTGEVAELRRQLAETRIAELEDLLREHPSCLEGFRRHPLW